MNINDPYGEMIGLMREHGSKLNPPSIQLGEVLSTSPLLIHTNDIQLNPGNLYVADYLIPYKRKINLPTTPAIGKTTSEDIKEIGIEGEVTFSETLKVKDMVALIQIDQSNFLVFCKAVRP